MAGNKKGRQKNLKKPISVAIVGLGHWGPNLARIVHENPHTLLTYCCDLKKENLLKIKSIYPYIKITTSLANILNNRSVDAVIVAVPAAEHFPVVKKILEANKDVLVEKPLATSEQEAHILITLAKRKKRILMVDHTFVFNPGIQRIKKLIKSNALGKIHYGYGDYTALGPIRNDVSALWDLATHFLYTISYLLKSPPVAISASGKAFLTNDIIDVAFVNLEFADGTLFNLRVSWADPVKTRTMVLVGSKKMVSFDDGRTDGKVIIYDRGVDKDENNSLLKHLFTFRYGNIVFPHIPATEPLAEVLKSFILSVKKRRLQPITSRDFINLVVLLEAAQHSLKHNHQTVRLNYNLRNKIISLPSK